MMNNIKAIMETDIMKCLISKNHFCSLSGSLHLVEDSTVY